MPTAWDSSTYKVHVLYSQSLPPATPPATGPRAQGAPRRGGHREQANPRSRGGEAESGGKGERRAPRPDSQRPATTKVATGETGSNDCDSGLNPGELPPFWTASLLTPPHERREYQKKGRTQSGAVPFKVVVPFNQRREGRRVLFQTLSHWKLYREMGKLGEKL